MARTTFVTATLLSCVLLMASPAHADITGFWGLTPKPEVRASQGFAAGVSLVVVGFEFELSNTAQDLVKGAPGLTTGMLNGVIQTPTSTQFYLTAGGGVFRERLGSASETFVGTNIGGGVKINLAGPVRLRLDYRIFALRGSPLFANPQRLYAGVNVAF
jgi:opacity protein-like surface antigen